MSESKIALRVAQIRNAVKSREMTFQAISDISGLSLSTIAPMFKENWDPRLSTLVALESAILGKSKKRKTGNV